MKVNIYMNVFVINDSTAIEFNILHILLIKKGYSNLFYNFLYQNRHKKENKN